MTAPAAARVSSPEKRERRIPFLRFSLRLASPVTTSAAFFASVVTTSAACCALCSAVAAPAATAPVMASSILGSVSSTFSLVASVRAATVARAGAAASRASCARSWVLAWVQDLASSTEWADFAAAPATVGATSFLSPCSVGTVTRLVLTVGTVTFFVLRSNTGGPSLKGGRVTVLLTHPALCRAGLPTRQSPAGDIEASREPAVGRRTQTLVGRA